MPLKKSYSEVTIPLQKMSFTPDVPSGALGANEYNAGENVETDVRGIRSVLGEANILDEVPGTPTFVTGGFRTNDLDPTHSFYFVIANDEGQWWANNGDGSGWNDITPQTPNYVTSRFGLSYGQSLNITESWNGTCAIFNDGINPPFFWLDNADAPMTPMLMYSNEYPRSITNIAYASPTTQTITVSQPWATAPYIAGDEIVITGTNNYYNGTYTVVSSTTTTVTYTATPGGAFSKTSYATVSAKYTWNVDPNIKYLAAGFVRLYSTPNVGNILVAGNLTSEQQDTSVNRNPVTVQWSQAFALNAVPLTWAVTAQNIANQLEVPLRGTVLDAFPVGGNLYLSSYWDTVVLTPLNYTTTSAPILGVRLFNQGRGLLNANCWSNTDAIVYGIDARDFWSFNGNNFTGLGNQRVKHWFFDQLDPAYWDRVYMITNTEKNQIEIYYPTKDAVNGVPNKMLSYRYDLDAWNAPRDVLIATFATESPVWTWDPDTGTGTYNQASRCIVYAKGSLTTPLIQKDFGYTFVKLDGDTRAISSSFRRDNLKLVKDYSTKVLVHRVLPEIVNLNDNNVEIDPTVNPELVGNVKARIEGANSVGQSPLFQDLQTLSTDTNYPWIQINQNAHRVDSIELTSDDNETPGTIWMCNAVTFQFTEVEDDR